VLLVAFFAPVGITLAGGNAENYLNLSDLAQGTDCLMVHF